MEPHPEAMQESEQAVPAQEPVDHPLPGLDDPLSSGDNPNSPFPDRPPNRLWQKEMDDLRDHRMNGHATYHPACPQCIACRGVQRHARRQGTKGIEIQADFAVLGRHKVLALVEVSSNSMGFVYMRASHEVTANEVLAWARSIGVTGPSTCVVYVKLDAEPSLVSFLERSLPATCQI